MAMPKKPIALTPTATLLEKAVLAKEQNPKIAPRLLLEALRQRIHEVVPDPDPDLWVAALKLAREVDDLGVESVCWSLLMFEKDFGAKGDFNDEEWEDCFDGAEAIIGMLEAEYA